MPLRVHLPSSQPLAAWRAPWWQRILCPAAGVAMVTAAFWPYAGEAYEPLWLLAALGVGLVWYALRPKLVLYPDAVYVRGHILSRVIPIDQVSAVQGGYGGLTIWWGDGSMSEAPAIGEQNLVGWLPGDDSREVDMRELILSTRDAYLFENGLAALPDPREVAERQRREFRERGWVEHNPPLVDRRKPDRDD